MENNDESSMDFGAIFGAILKGFGTIFGFKNRSKFDHDFGVLFRSKWMYSDLFLSYGVL